MTPSLPACLLVAGMLLALAACGEPTDTDTDSAASPAPEDAAAVTGPPADGAPASRWDGTGQATFGMSADEVRAAWDGGLAGNAVEEDPACFHLRPASQPEGAYFAMMFGEDRFVRYSLSNDAMTAPGGGRRGMSGEEIEGLYPGRVERQPHKYSDGEYLRIPGEGGSVLVFETDASGRVTQWRVGLPPYVDYVEGCA